MSGHPKPTLGYASQWEAIEALFREGNDAHDIKAMTGVSINVVHRVLSNYRKLHRIPKPAYDYSKHPKSTGVSADAIWEKFDDDKRQAFHSRAVKAAREARLAP